jgi:hypothetical protein
MTGSDNGIDLATVVALREEWRRAIEGDGAECPCCARWGKVYPRHINETMARSLIWLCAAPLTGDWVYVPATAPRWLVRSNQLPTLRWWDLVERAASDDKIKKHSGLWRPTQLGRDFAEGKITVPKTVYTYNGTRERYGDKMTTINACFGTHFSYQDVMRGTVDSGEADDEADE